MKKLVTFFLILTLVCSLSISAFAVDYNGTALPDFTGLMEENPQLSYAIIVKQGLSPVVTLYLMDDATFDSIEITIGAYTGGDSFKFTSQNNNPCKYYTVQNGVWSLKATEKYGTTTKVTEYIYSIEDLVATNGTIVLYGSGTSTNRECDGTSCPANDNDHDNICDDCGNVLTLSLRSTLLDYAKYQAEEFGPFASTHKYYAVVEHPTEADTYFIYVSAALMGSTDGQTVTGVNMQRGQVVIQESGAFATRGGWSSVESWSGSVVYANQTIPFFFRVPLTVTIQGPTGELMEMEAPNLKTEFSTLALCGIGCLALLISLHVLSNLLRKSFQRT